MSFISANSSSYDYNDHYRESNQINKDNNMKKISINETIKQISHGFPILLDPCWITMISA